MNRNLLQKLYDMSTSLMYSYYDDSWKHYNGDSVWTKCIVCTCNRIYKRKYGKNGNWDVLGKYFFNTYVENSDKFFKLIRKYIPMSGVRSMVIENE